MKGFRCTFDSVINFIFEGVCYNQANPCRKPGNSFLKKFNCVGTHFNLFNTKRYYGAFRYNLLFILILIKIKNKYDLSGKRV